MKSRIAILDLVRLAAALVVLMFHYVSMGRSLWDLSQAQLAGLRAATDYGWLGVNLFFMVSGFVICMSAWGKPLGEYLAARVVRLYPAYVAAVVLTTAFLTAVPGPAIRQSFSDVLVNLTMLQQPLAVPNVDAPYWTLWCELLFYLLFAGVVWRGLTYGASSASAPLGRSPRSWSRMHHRRHGSSSSTQRFRPISSAG